MAAKEWSKTGFGWSEGLIRPINVKAVCSAKNVKTASDVENQTSATASQPKYSASSDIALGADTEKKHPAANRLDGYSGAKLEIFDQNDVIQHENSRHHTTGDPDEKRCEESLIKMIAERGNVRKLVPIPADWERILSAFDSQFPNFAEVIEYLRGMFTLASFGDGVLMTDPILLNGPPGIGKTYFAEQFARQMDLGFHCIRMENSQANSELCGSSNFWSNSKPGALFAWLTEKDSANPIFFLDEIDKVSGDTRFDPLSPLYALFEPSTAASFKDLSAPWLTLNASKVTWIATCNDADSLPAPILSRVKRFDIPTPSLEDSQRLIVKIFRRVREDYAFTPAGFRITCSAVKLLQAESPRKVKQLLRESLSRALRRGSRRIEPCDLRIRGEVSARRRIGFLS